MPDTGSATQTVAARRQRPGRITMRRRPPQDCPTNQRLQDVIVACVPGLMVGARATGRNRYAANGTEPSQDVNPYIDGDSRQRPASFTRPPRRPTLR